MISVMVFMVALALVWLAAWALRLWPRLLGDRGGED